MSESSFDVTCTPMASRRISMLPISHADLSSPTTAARQIQVLELENVALADELTTATDRIRHLEADIDRLTCSSSSSESAISSSSIDMAHAHRLAAELKSAKRLVHRLIAKIASHPPSSPHAELEDDMFSLDRSITHDPERSVVVPLSTHITTPNGKTKVARSFDADLLDDVQSLADAFKQHAKQLSFSTAEASLALQSANVENQTLCVRIQELEADLASARHVTPSSPDPDAVIQQLQTQLDAASQRETELQTHLEQSHSTQSSLQQKLTETTAKLDQITAEQELTISAAAKKSAAQIEALQMQLQEQLSSTNTPGIDCDACGRMAQLQVDPDAASAASAELQQQQNDRDAADKASAAQIEALQVELDRRRSKSSDLHAILQELHEKKNRLHAIELHNSQLKSLEKVLAQQQRIVDLLDRQATQNDAGGAFEWMSYSHQLSSLLEQLKCAAKSTAAKQVKDESIGTEMVTTNHVEASIMTDAFDASSTRNQNDELVSTLQEQISEMEARILRRNEQIGSLQRQLRNVENDLARTRTNQTLAEQTVFELDAERVQHLDKIKLLEEHVARVEASSDSESRARRVQAEMQTDDEADALREMQAALQTAKEETSELRAQLGQLTAENAGLEAQKTEIENTIAQLTHQVHTLETALEQAKSLDEQRESEISLLTCQLEKSDDRLTTIKLELEGLHVSLAERREASSLDAERIQALESQLSTVQADHSALTSSATAQRQQLEQARSTIDELNAKIAALVRQVEPDQNKARALQTELVELQAKHAELERVLLERDQAIQNRNTEYWSLKEELAELQDEVERSRSDPSAHVVGELQSQLAAAVQAKSHLEERIGAQEAALLRIKSDLASARSTEELLNHQYSASQRRIMDLEVHVHQLESDPRASETPTQDADLKHRMQEAESEIGYLTTRISQLEEELSRKAEEIEEADSKILDALKESKKYATRYTKLSGRFEVLQAEVKAKEARVDEVEQLLRVERERVVCMEKENGKRGEHDKRLASGGLAGRKRAKPDSVDDEMHVAATAKTRSALRQAGVKAVYAPSPRTPAASFTPVRRAVAHSAARAHTNASAPPLVLGQAPPSNHAIVRSTSNPSELIAQRFSTSPAAAVCKPLLSDRTNLSSTTAPVGTSRLSSKMASSGADAAKCTSTHSSAADSRPDSVVAPCASAAAGAADFLARIKAQRAAASQRA